LDGRLAGETKSELAGQINLKPNATLKIGHGVHDHFRGRLRDVSINRGAAGADAIQMQFHQSTRH
jgi:hypothetical protein